MPVLKTFSFLCLITLEPVVPYTEMPTKTFFYTVGRRDIAPVK